MNNYQMNFRDQFPKVQKQYQQPKNEYLYDPYQGFIRGNMFKGLYDPYKINKPYDIKPMNEQAELLTYIDALCFACIDLELYLDVFPEDKEKIQLFNQYKEEKNNIIKKYENQFGPLSLDSDNLNKYPWSWDDKPWPWENN